MIELNTAYGCMHDAFKNSLESSKDLTVCIHVVESVTVVSSSLLKNLHFNEHYLNFMDQLNIE